MITNIFCSVFPSSMIHDINSITPMPSSDCHIFGNNTKCAMQKFNKIHPTIYTFFTDCFLGNNSERIQICAIVPAALAYISAAILTTSIYFSPGHIPYMRVALYRVYCFRCLFPCHYIKLFSWSLRF